MRYSRFFLRTLRSAPGDIDTSGLQLLFRGGYVARAERGSTMLLPLGVLLQRRLLNLIAARLQDVGVQPVFIDEGSPSALDSADPLFSSRIPHRDPFYPWRSGFIAAVSHVVQSYRQLPVRLYALGRDRRGTDVAAASWLDVLPTCALVGCYVEDAEHATDGGLQDLADALQDLCGQVGVEALWVPAGRDAKGDVVLRRLVVTDNAGDRELLRCSRCGTLEDSASVRVQKPNGDAEVPRPMREVETPGCQTIAALCEFLGVNPSQTAKAIFQTALTSDGDERFVVAVVRGDTDFNPHKLAGLLQCVALRSATDAEIWRVGAVPGYGSPIGLQRVTVVVDELVTQSTNLVAGANVEGSHLLDVTYGRDFKADVVGDIVLARPGDACPVCGEPMEALSSFEIGWLGADPPDAVEGESVWYTDALGESLRASQSNFGLLVHRLVGAMTVQNQDARGVVWPYQVAPFDVYLMTVGQSVSRVTVEAERLYADLTMNDLSVLYDDRDERAGVKFTDADLSGIPVRIVVGDRGLREEVVEIKSRAAEEAENVPLDEVLSYVQGILSPVVD
jgi:prolyl-tRNA synthetase